MTADVASYPFQQPYRTQDSASMASSFSYSSHPRPLYYDSYKNLTDSAKPLHANIMYDKRVIRGNTWALRRIATDALTKNSSEERRQMQERRRQIRQRVQSKLKNDSNRYDRVKRKGDGTSITSASTSATSGATAGSRKRNDLISPNQISPTIVSRRSMIIEEEPHIDEKPTVWSSGDSGIAVGGTASARSLMDEIDNADHHNNLQSTTAEIHDYGQTRSDSFEQVHDNQFEHPLPKPEITESESELEVSENRSDIDLENNQKIDNNRIDQQIDLGETKIEDEVKPSLDTEMNRTDEIGMNQSEDIDMAISSDHKKSIDRQLEEAENDLAEEYGTTESSTTEERRDEIIELESDSKALVQTLLIDSLTRIDLLEPINEKSIIDKSIENHSSFGPQSTVQQSLAPEFDSFSIRQDLSLELDNNAIDRSDLSIDQQQQQQYPPLRHDPDFCRDPCMSPIDELSIFNPIFSSAAQTRVSELLEISLRRVVNLLETRRTIDINEKIDNQEIDSGSSIDTQKSIDGTSDYQASIDQSSSSDTSYIKNTDYLQSITDFQDYDYHQIDLSYNQSMNEDIDFSLIDYCRYVLDQLIEVAIQNLLYSDNRYFAEQLSEILVENVVQNSVKNLISVTLRDWKSDRMIDDLLESSVQNVVDLSLTEAVDELAIEDRLTRNAWLDEENLQSEWDRQLRELEANVVNYGYSIDQDDQRQKSIEIATDQYSMDRSIIDSNRNYMMITTNENLIDNDRRFDPSRIGDRSRMDLGTRIDKSIDLVSKIDFKNINDTEAKIIRDELFLMKMELEKERREKDHLSQQYKIAIDQCNRYACHSIAQEQSSSIFHRCMDRFGGDHIFSTSDHNTQKISDGNQTHQPLVFTQENFVLFDDCLSNDGEADKATRLRGKAAEGIYNDITQDLEPWLYGKAYGDVAKEMTNLWLRDATGGRSQYCRCSAQRPLRRLLSEIEELQHH